MVSYTVIPTIYRKLGAGLQLLYQHCIISSKQMIQIVWVFIAGSYQE